MPPRTHVHSRLWWRQLIFLIAAGLLAVALLADMIAGKVAWYEGVLAYAVGTLLGYGYGRLKKVQWDAEREQVMTQNDVLSILLIVLYIAARTLGDTLLKNVAHGAALTAITFAFVGGILLGRYFGVLQSVRRVLREQGKLPH